MIVLDTFNRPRFDKNAIHLSRKIKDKKFATGSFGYPPDVKEQSGSDARYLITGASTSINSIQQQETSRGSIVHGSPSTFVSESCMTPN